MLETTTLYRVEVLRRGKGNVWARWSPDTADVAEAMRRAQEAVEMGRTVKVKTVLIFDRVDRPLIDVID